VATDTKSGGGGLKKKAGPLPVWGWVAVAGGTFVVYRFLKARSAASAAAGTSAAQGLTGGSLIPNDIGLPSGTSNTGGAGTFSSVAAWTQALLTSLVAGGMSPGDSYTAAQAFLNGNCVSQAAYTGIATALESGSVGLPPGYTAPPALSVCPSTTQTPTPTNPTPAPAAQATALPWVNSNTYQQIVHYGQYSPSDYTKIGTYTNGVYSGANVGGGAPVYGTAYGGFFQGFNPATYNGDVYIPTALYDLGYATPSETFAPNPA
jgi:hypothetical protein